MARVTKALRQELEEAKKMEACKAYQAAYPNRLMDVLGRATKLGWEISVGEGVFEVRVG